MIFLWACRAGGDLGGVLTDGSVSTMVAAAARILLDHIIEHQYQQVMALHWLGGVVRSHHTHMVVPTTTALPQRRKISILLIYWTQDCVNVCLGLVWNRYDIINININLLINAGNSSLSLHQQLQIEYIFWVTKLIFAIHCVSSNFAFDDRELMKLWLKCVIVSRGRNGGERDERGERGEMSSNIYQRSTCYLS